MSVIQQYAGTSGFTGQLFWARLGQADSPKYRPSEKKTLDVVGAVFFVDRTALQYHPTSSVKIKASRKV